MIVFELAEVNAVGFGYKCDEVLDFIRALDYKIYKIQDKGNLIEVKTNPDKFPGSPSFVAIK